MPIANTIRVCNLPSAQPGKTILQAFVDGSISKAELAAMNDGGDYFPQGSFGGISRSEAMLDFIGFLSPGLSDRVLYNITHRLAEIESTRGQECMRSTTLAKYFIRHELSERHGNTNPFPFVTLAHLKQYLFPSYLERESKLPSNNAETEVQNSARLIRGFNTFVSFCLCDYQNRGDFYSQVKEFDLDAFNPNQLNDQAVKTLQLLTSDLVAGLAQAPLGNHAPANVENSKPPSVAALIQRLGFNEVPIVISKPTGTIKATAIFYDPAAKKSIKEEIASIQRTIDDRTQLLTMLKTEEPKYAAKIAQIEQHLSMLMAGGVPSEKVVGDADELLPAYNEALRDQAVAKFKIQQMQVEIYKLAHQLDQLKHKVAEDNIHLSTYRGPKK